MDLCPLHMIFLLRIFLAEQAQRAANTARGAKRFVVYIYV